jgi:hypothetical protein
MNDPELAAALAAIHQGRRQLPDASLVRLRLLAIDLEQVPARRHPWSAPLGGSRHMFSATKLVVASLTLALFGSLLYGGLLLTRPDEATPAELGTAAPTSSVTPGPTAAPSPSPRPASDAKRAQTRQIAAFEDGVDPIDLARSPSGAFYVIDAGGDGLVQVDRDGYQTMVAALQDPYAESPAIASGARLLTTSPRGVYVVRDDGRVFEAQEITSGFNLISMNGGGTKPLRDGSYDPVPPFASVPVAATTVGQDRDDLRLYAIDATSGTVLSTGLEPRGPLAPPETLAELDTEDVGSARDLYADRDVYVLHERALRRYRDGRLDRRFAAELPSGEEDLRLLAGTGGRDGRLFVLDQGDGGRLLEVSKSDGRLLDTWALAEQPLDIRGMVAEGGTAGQPATVTWVTPEGLFESVLSTEPVLDEPAEERSPSPPADPGGKAITWAGSAVQLEADGLRIVANGKVFRGVPSVEIDDWAGTDDRELHAVWHEDGTEMRINLYLHSDGSQWWIDEIWVYDGKPEADWVYYQQLDAETRTPVGEALEIDLDLRGARFDDDAADKRKARQLADKARLRIDGLRLTAFEPGTGPAPITGCEPIANEAEETEIKEAIAGMTVAEVEAYLAEAGICREYDYSYTVDPAVAADGARGERWCAAPPEGEVRSVHAGMTGNAVVWVEDFVLKAHDREAPTMGWGCPLDDGTVLPLPEPRALPAADRTDLEPLPADWEADGGRFGEDIRFETSTMLPGQRQRVEAKWCAPNGCVPLEVRWKAESPYASITRDRGTWTELVAQRPGSPSLDVLRPRSHLGIAFTIQPLPDDPASRRLEPGRRPVAYPVRQILEPGQYFVLTSWRCRSEGARRFGDDRRPGTEDDGCEVEPIESAGPLDGSGVSVVGRFGPSVLMRVDPDSGGDLRFAGVFMRYADRAVGPFPFLYVREGDREAPGLGDLDADGEVDADDLALVEETRALSDDPVLPADDAWQAALDLNQDRRIDEVDLAIETTLVGEQR